MDVKNEELIKVNVSLQIFAKEIWESFYQIILFYLSFLTLPILIHFSLLIFLLQSFFSFLSMLRKVFVLELNIELARIA